MHFSQIEGSKVCKEWLVDKIVVDAEIKGVRSGLGRVSVTDPVESVGDDFNSLIVHIFSKYLNY